MRSPAMKKVREFGVIHISIQGICRKYQKVPCPFIVLLFYVSYMPLSNNHMLEELDPQQIALSIAEVQNEPRQRCDELGQ